MMELYRRCDSYVMHDEAIRTGEYGQCYVRDEQAERYACMGEAVYAILARWQKINRVSVEELRSVAHDLHTLEGIDTCGFGSAVLSAVADAKEAEEAGRAVPQV